MRWTIWGPIIGRDHRGRDLAQRWVAHDASVLASDITALERARTLDEALATAAGIGIPGQNFTAGDSSGRIGWTIAGPIPHRVGFDGSRPTSWADGQHRWDGYLSRDAFPRVVDPESGRLWTANAPVVEGEMLATIGEGGYADGIRARVIRDRLMAIDKATAADMLSVQLDDSALFHERWRTLLLATLTPAVVEGHPSRAEFRRLVDTTWTGHAAPASVGYRLVRTFRAALARSVFGALTAPASRADPDFDYARTLRSEGPLWQLVTERPVHLLDPRFSTWDAALVAAADTAIEELTTDGAKLSDRSWGEFNRAIVLASARQRPAADWTLAQHARRPAAGRHLRAARALAACGPIRAHGRVTGARTGRHPAHADRTERAPAVAALRGSASRLGGRRRRSVPAGPVRDASDACAARGIAIEQEMASAG